MSAGIPEISHLVDGSFGRPASLFRLVRRRMVSGLIVGGRWRRRLVGGSGRSTLVTLQSRLEEPRDPLEG